MDADTGVASRINAPPCHSCLVAAVRNEGDAERAAAPSHCRLVFCEPDRVYLPAILLERLGRSMKADIHPEYATATVKCACGNTFQTRSTIAEIHTDICNVCHPFFTGKQKLVDTAGRVERFRQKYGKTN